MIKLLKQILFAIFLGVFGLVHGSTEIILINCNIIDGTGKPVAKNMVIRKLESARGVMDTFIRTDNGYRVTPAEGFVAIDQIGNAVKLVDRMEFSRANFNAAKHLTK